MKSFLIIMILLSFESLFAQGEYLDRGNNAFSYGLSVAIHPKVVGFSGEAAGTTLGTVDIGFAYAMWFSQSILSSNRTYSSVYSPYVNIHAVKQSEVFPLSISACFQYDIAAIGTFIYGAAVFHSFHITEKYSLQPSFKYSLADVKVNGYSDKTNSIPFTELSLAFTSKNGNKISAVHASITFSEQQPIYSIGFGMVNIF